MRRRRLQRLIGVLRVQGKIHQRGRIHYRTALSRRLSSALCAERRSLYGERRQSITDQHSFYRIWMEYLDINSTSDASPTADTLCAARKTVIPYRAPHQTAGAPLFCPQNAFRPDSRTASNCTRPNSAYLVSGSFYSLSGRPLFTPPSVAPPPLRFSYSYDNDNRRLAAPPAGSCRILLLQAQMRMPISAFQPALNACKIASLDAHSTVIS